MGVWLRRRQLQMCALAAGAVRALHRAKAQIREHQKEAQVWFSVEEGLLKRAFVGEAEIT